MKMKKSFIAVISRECLAVTSLVGCGKKDTGEKSKDGTEVASDYKINLGYYN